MISAHGPVMRSTLLIPCLVLAACGSVTPPEGVDAGTEADAAAADGALADAGLLPLAQQRVAFVSNRAGDRDIWVMNLDGSDPLQVTSGADDDLFGSISPDGARVVFARSGDIFAVDIDGTNLDQLTMDPALDTRPAFSRDGTRIVFTSSREGGNNIFVMNADGSDQVAVTSGTDTKTFGMFNHDGTRVTYTSNNEIHVVNIDGSGDQVLFSDPAATDVTAAFSHDGSKVVFSSDRDGALDLYVGNADGSGVPERVATEGNVDPVHASFDVEGNHLIYYANLPENANRAVFITEIASGETTPLTDSTTSDQKIGSWVIPAP
jgi:Tol biopolymer transport system component